MIPSEREMTLNVQLNQVNGKSIIIKSYLVEIILNSESNARIFKSQILNFVRGAAKT